MEDRDGDKPLWGLRVLKFDGAIAPRVLKFDSGYAAEGCGGRLLIDRRRPFIKNLHNRAFARGKTGQPRFARGNTFPLWWLAPPPFPVGSMSLDSRVTGLPYESSSFATPPLRGVLFCPPGWGKVRRSRIRRSRAATNHQNANQAL